MGWRDVNELLTPEEVLQRYDGGPKTGVFTDGSCEGNPGPGGWGVVCVEDDAVVEERSGVDPLPEDSRVTIYSDSQLCVNTINEWAAGWERRGWRRKSGPIANLELVKTLYALAQKHADVTLAWIKAHDGSRWNEYADALASAYMRE
jgi:ribonuclease HI